MSKIASKIAIIAITIIVLSYSIHASEGIKKSTVLKDTAQADIWLQSNKSAVNNIEFINGGGVAGVQFDILSPELTKDNYTCGSDELRSTHEVMCKYHEKSNFVRVIVFSLPVSDVPNSTILSFNGTVNQRRYNSNTRDKARLTNIIFSDAQGENITPQHLVDIN